jgi:hypothetical protein
VELEPDQLGSGELGTGVLQRVGGDRGARRSVLASDVAQEL